MKFGLSSVQQETGIETAIRFPFRVTNMRLPLSAGDLTPDELRKQAAALGWGLGGTDTIKEVYEYVRFMYHCGDDSKDHTPYDTFKSGVGECGHINDLGGVFLELNGIPYRGVSGFNPIARTVFPGGGHSGIEAWNEDLGQWTYFDSYLGFQMDGPITDIRNSEYWHIPVFPSTPEISELGDYVSLGELYRFPQYYDKGGRLPIIPLHNIYDRSDDYGRFWKMAEGGEFSSEELFLETVTVYVRARFVDTDGVGLSKDQMLSGSFSEHTLTTFLVGSKS